MSYDSESVSTATGPTTLNPQVGGDHQNFHLLSVSAEAMLTFAFVVAVGDTGTVRMHTSDVSELAEILATPETLLTPATMYDISLWDVLGGTGRVELPLFTRQIRELANLNHEPQPGLDPGPWPDEATGKEFLASDLAKHLADHETAAQGGWGFAPSPELLQASEEFTRETRKIHVEQKRTMYAQMFTPESQSAGFASLWAIHILEALDAKRELNKLPSGQKEIAAALPMVPTVKVAIDAIVRAWNTHKVLLIPNGWLTPTKGTSPILRLKKKAYEWAMGSLDTLVDQALSPMVAGLANPRFAQPETWDVVGRFQAPARVPLYDAWFWGGRPTKVSELLSRHVLTEIVVPDASRRIAATGSFGATVMMNKPVSDAEPFSGDEVLDSMRVRLPLVHQDEDWISDMEQVSPLTVAYGKGQQQTDADEDGSLDLAALAVQVLTGAETRTELKVGHGYYVTPGAGALLGMPVIVPGWSGDSAPHTVISGVFVAIRASEAWREEWVVKAAEAGGGRTPIVFQEPERSYSRSLGTTAPTVPALPVLAGKAQ